MTILEGNKVRYYAVVDPVDGYFNGHRTYDEALDEFHTRKKMDEDNLLLVAVLYPRDKP